MILRSKVPNRVVQKRKKIHGRRGWRVVPIFKFDENGLAEIDESKFTQSDIQRLKTLFEVVDTVQDHKADGKLNLRELSYQELKKLCKEKGIKAGRVSKEELIQLLEV